MERENIKERSEEGEREKKGRDERKAGTRFLSRAKSNQQNHWQKGRAFCVVCVMKLRRKIMEEKIMTSFPNTQNPNPFPSPPSLSPSVYVYIYPRTDPFSASNISFSAIIFSHTYFSLSLYSTLRSPFRPWQRVSTSSSNGDRWHLNSRFLQLAPFACRITGFHVVTSRQYLNIG